MPTPAEVDALQAEVDDLRTLAVADLVALWGSEVAPNPAAGVDTLRTVLAELSEEYAQAAAAVAVEFYTSVRPTGPSFTPQARVPADLVPGRTLNWASEPLLTETWADALDRTAADLQKTVMAGAIETIGEATVEDPLEPKYARFPQNTNPCAWCVLRASKGAVYWSQETATRGDHTSCKCKVTVVFPGEPLPYLRAPYMAQYLAGADEADGRGTKALLAGMRRANGIR